ncbi:hypothetical protein ACE3MZ_21865 [Paenibacillus sp. WLX1005]|uniref:hypothetical protein n=1 Tax=Paenibacillus sp. WLX1005 TaxID=3243766 RepID=UPI0039842BB5
MNINMINGLPVVSLKLTYGENVHVLERVLLDTGCSTTIFDTDAVQPIGLYIDFIQGQSVRMYGVGGQSELCYQQPVSGLYIDDLKLEEFTIQLGITRDTYGFDAILGVDILLHYGMVIDFKNLKVLKQ